MQKSEWQKEHENTHTVVYYIHKLTVTYKIIQDALAIFKSLLFI